jgi:hypothetical protein
MGVVSGEQWGCGHTSHLCPSRLPQAVFYLAVVTYPNPTPNPTPTPNPNQAVFYSAVVTWLLPSGYLAGFHFRILGRPLDYQVAC